MLNKPLFFYFFSLCFREETTISTMAFDRRLCGKILLIQSVLLTKGLITSHLRVTKSELAYSLNHLIEKELLKNGKYLQCGKRQVDAYLKYVPEHLQEKTTKYSLQRSLLEFDVDVDVYIDSVKSIKFFKPHLRPSTLLLSTLSEVPYIQCNIDLSIEEQGKIFKRIYHI